MARYLITGGAGFIGRHLCADLHEAGHDVRILDSLVEQAHGYEASAALPPAEFLHGDVRDPDAVEHALRDVDGVFHLAAEVGVGQSMYEVERYVSANDLGTAVLMQAVIQSSVQRVVVASSMSVYGEGLYRTAGGRVDESVRRSPEDVRQGRWDPVDRDGQPFEPLPTAETKRHDLASVYALTKFNQEQMVLMLGAAYGIDTVALRLFNVFGPGQALSNPYTGVLAIFAGRLLNGEPPMIFEDGLQRRDFVHVRDVVQAFRLAMETPNVAGEVFNIGSGRSYTVERAARLLADAMGKGEIGPDILNQGRTGDVRHCFADIARARSHLGYTPVHRLEDSLPELVDWVARQSANDRVPQAHRELQERGLVA